MANGPIKPKIKSASIDNPLAGVTIDIPSRRIPPTFGQYEPMGIGTTPMPMDSNLSGTYLNIPPRPYNAFLDYEDLTGMRRGIYTPPTVPLQGVTLTGAPFDTGTLDSGAAGKSMGDKLATVGGATAAGMGLVQLAVGLNQARKAKRLPFPSFRQAAAPLVESKNLYQQMYERGLGTERENIYRSNLAAQQASAMRNISQGSPQASQYAGRVASLSNIQAEQGITQADIQARQGALAGMERVNSALSALGLRQIASEREYRMLAEQAAGQAIKTGTENIARGALLFGGAQQVA